jgi:hypothetical protein
VGREKHTRGVAKMSDDDDIFEKLFELNQELEKNSLLPDRYYIILNEVDDESVSMAVYDTTDQSTDDDSISAAQVLTLGLLEIMESDFEKVMEAGMFRLSMLDFDSKTAKITDRSLGDNVVKVDFGKKH